MHCKVSSYWQYIPFDFYSSNYRKEEKFCDYDESNNKFYTDNK